MASIQPSSIRRALIGLFRRGDEGAILPGYARPRFWQRHPFLWALLYMGVIIAYGVALGLTGRAYLMAMLIPVIVLALLIIWVLPESENPPVRWVRILLFGFLAVLLVWPDYLALDILGLPWITAVRLFAFPLAAVLLICLSTSPRFRAELRETLSTTPLTWKLVAVFAVIAGVSVGFSSDPGFSANRYIVALLYWIMIFFCSAWVFRRPGTAIGLAYLIWAAAIIVCLIGVLEWQMKALPWAGRIPSFLTIDDPLLQQILVAKSRATTGIYRLQSKFLTPISFAEFLALATPVVLFFLVFTRSVLLRIAAMLSLALIAYCVFRTDSRLGMGGFLTSFLLFILAWSVLRWRQVKDSIMGPAITLAYPAMFAAFVAATFFIGRLRVMVWGGGAQSFSDQARQDQVATGIPLILSQPWGRGIGRGGAELGFTTPSGFLTIDSYFLQVGLEFGIIGFLVYYGIFIAQIRYSAINVLKARTTEHLLVVPLTVAMINFVIIKTVLSQQDNHALVFAMLGALTALIWRIQSEAESIPAARFPTGAQATAPSGERQGAQQARTAA